MNFSLSYGQQIGKRDMVQIKYLQDEAWDIGYPALPMDVSSASSKMISGTYLHSFGVENRNSLDLKIYHNRVAHIMDDSKRPDAPMHMDMPGRTQTSGAILSTSLRTSNGNSLQTKFEVYDSYSMAEMTMYPEGQSPMYMQTWPGIRQTGTSLGINGTTSLSEILKGNAGIRMELVRMYMEEEFGVGQFQVFNKENTRSEITPLPTVFGGLEVKVSRNSAFAVQGSYGMRMPSNSEKFGFFIFNSTDRFDYVGDPTLDPETSIKLDLEYSYSSGSVDMKITQFNYHFNNYILGIAENSLQAMTPGSQGVKIYQNTPQAYLHGVEVFSQIALAKGSGIISTVNYTYGNDFEGQPLPFIPPLKIIGSTYSSIRSILIQPEIVFAASQNRVSEKNLESTTPSFWLFNLKVSREIPIKNGRLKGMVGVENIFDNLYREHIDWGGIPRPGRNIFFDFAFTF